MTFKRKVVLIIPLLPPLLTTGMEPRRIMIMELSERILKLQHLLHRIAINLQGHSETCITLLRHSLHKFVEAIEYISCINVI